MAADGSDLFGATFACACGKTHAIEPREVLFAPGAAAATPDLCARALAGQGRRVAAVMDPWTREAAGEAVAAALAAAGWDVRVLEVPAPGGEPPVCDEPTRDTLAGRLAPCDLLVSVGSGVVTDLTKWLAHGRDVPFVAFGTAASMNGYASANVAPTVGAVKTLVRARPPAAVASDPAVLAAAPAEMTAAGLGDVLAKATSSLDWYLNHRLFGDDYCARSVALVEDLEPLYAGRPEALAAGDAAALEALFRALLLTGVAMTMAETSAPASGGEHLVSHTLDMLARRDGRPHDLHGRQVGVGTVLAAALWQRVLVLEMPAWVAPAEAIDAAFWGDLAPAVAPQYAQKRPRLAQAREALPRHWDALRAEVGPRLRPAAALKETLARAGAAHRAEDIGLAKCDLAAVLARAREMRPRVTVLDLAHLAGVLPDAAEDLVEAWA